MSKAVSVNECMQLDVIASNLCITVNLQKSSLRFSVYVTVNYTGIQENILFWCSSGFHPLQKKKENLFLCMLGDNSLSRKGGTGVILVPHKFAQVLIMRSMKKHQILKFANG